VTSQSRRSIVVSLVVGAAIGASLTGLAILMFSGSDGSPGPGWVRVGTLDQVRTKQVLYVAELHAYVVADPRQSPIAFLARSPQMGEPVEFCLSSGWFEDPAHGSKFDRLGRYELGPAPRGLDRMAIVVLDGVVWVDPTEITLGPPRGEKAAAAPAGPFCTAVG
jgi:hypothetical protein